MHFRTSTTPGARCWRAGLFNLSLQVKPVPTRMNQSCLLSNWLAADIISCLWIQRAILVFTTKFLSKLVQTEFSACRQGHVDAQIHLKHQVNCALSNICCRGFFFCICWTVPGLRRVMPQPPPPAPVSLLWRPLVSVTRHRVSRAGCPTPITFRWCWLMSMRSYKG